MRALVLAVPLLLGPGILALFSGGYSDDARAAAGVAAWLLLAATAVLLPRPLPRSMPAIVALAPLAAIAGAALYGLSERLIPSIVDLTDVLSAGDRLAQPLTYWNATGAFAALGLILAAALAGAPGRPVLVRAGAAATAP